MSSEKSTSSSSSNTTTTSNTDSKSELPVRKLIINPHNSKEDDDYVDNKTLRNLERGGDDTKGFVKQTEEETTVRFYPDRPTQRIHKDQFIVKEPSKFYDPCFESSRMAIRCMEQHDEDYKEVCAEYFHAYRECKKEWMAQRKKDSARGGIW